MLKYLTLSVFSYSAYASLGDGLWETFGHTSPLPLNATSATAGGWVKISSTCNNELGILYARSSGGPSKTHPLALYFSAGGQISGLQASVYGSNSAGNAAPDNLVEEGFWKVSGDHWVMDVSFRSSSIMCSGETSDSLLGEYVVINQDTIAYPIPLTAAEARGNNWTPGSCMTSMGQHHFYDLLSAPAQSYQQDMLLPIVPMYNPPDSTGVLHSFFFATPVVQDGSYDLLFGAHDWEAPFLVNSNMCQNWCDDDACPGDWKTSAWSTMHIYLSSAYKTLKCPGGSGIVGRSCNLNP